MNLKSKRVQSAFSQSVGASLLVASLFLSGCIIRRTVVPDNQRLLPAQTRSFKDLLQDLEACSNAIKTLRVAKVLFLPSEGARKKGQVTATRVAVPGFILVNRPNDIRIRLNLPLLGTTGADMVSDGRQYKVWIPLSNKMYVGQADESIQVGKLDMQLPPPKEIANAMFVDIRPYINNLKYKLIPKQTTLGTHSYYVVTVIDIEARDADGQVVEEIWVDRTNMEIVRQVAYGEEGLELTDTTFSGYQVSGDTPFPRVVTIYRPIEDVNLKITFQSSPDANAGIPADAFQLDPEGADVVEMPAQSAVP
jgi:outer membrane lipoprotein-sorting protein